MAINAVVSKTLEQPEVPFDKVRYRIVVNTDIGPDGKLKVSADIMLWPCRVLDYGLPTERWQDDPQRSKKVRQITDVFAFAAARAAAGDPSLAVAIGAINAAIDAINQAEQLV